MSKRQLHPSTSYEQGKELSRKTGRRGHRSKLDARVRILEGNPGEFLSDSRGQRFLIAKDGSFRRIDG
jgi:hypothetical protein